MSRAVPRDMSRAVPRDMSRTVPRDMPDAARGPRREKPVGFWGNPLYESEQREARDDVHLELVEIGVGFHEPALRVAHR